MAMVGNTAGDLEAMIARFPILRYFEYSHLPNKLQIISAPFAEIATQVAYEATFETKFSNAAEVAAGLRKLLEAKDCIVRAAL